MDTQPFKVIRCETEEEYELISKAVTCYLDTTQMMRYKDKQILLCFKCGYPVDSAFRFCPWCGRRFEEGE